MTTIEFFKNENGDIITVNCYGHANFANLGNDIVCAAISALVGGCALGLKEVAKINIKYTSNDKKGECKIQVPKTLDEESMRSAQILLQSLYVSLLDLEKGYQQNLKIKEYNYVY